MSKFRKNFKKKKKKNDKAHMGAAIIDAVENQLAENNPPATRETLDRLMAMGESRENALRYIANALMVELIDAAQNKNPYNEERYLKNLAKLPVLPDDPA